MKKVVLILLCAGLMACSDNEVHKKYIISADVDQSDFAKNVIFLIGDGMGLAQVSKVMQLNMQPLNLERATVIGLSKTASAKEQITDSAASATAFSIGEKTFNGAVGIDAKGKPRETILETLAARRFATGIIATSVITHATPASFYAHKKSRENYYSIAEDLVNAPVTLFIGGGEDHFDKRINKIKGKPDQRNLLNDLSLNGVSLVSTLEELGGSSGRVGFFIADEHPPSILNGRGDILPRSVRSSISYLQKQSDVGFFMVAEGSQIDWAGHGNDLDYLVSELVDFDDAVGAAFDFAQTDGNTLVVVTADHETGGLTLPSADNIGEDLYAEAGHAFSTSGHTATMVPVYAFGKGAEHFGGVYENTDIYQKLLTALGQISK